jgi:arylsulfatase A-like enzyme
VHEGPVVLITLDSLRADVVGGIGGGGRPGLMPHLEALAREADWAGQGIASSSWGVPAMASLFTGLRPWQHQAVTAELAALSPDLLTLPEALAARGYETAGFWSGHWYSEKLGYGQGFAAFEGLGRGRRAAERLAALGGGRQFVWVHIPEPQAPYLRRDAMIPRLGPDAPKVLPPRIGALQLQPFFDPAKPLPPGRRRRIWAMYRLNAAWADERLGRLLDALKQSGQWDRALVVVTANHGEEIGENRQILHGGNLGRPLLEVPLVVKLPQGFGRRIAEPRGRRVAVARLWATLVEAAGGTAPPAVAPSLFRHDGGAILSELYLTNGADLFSLLDGDDQLLMESRFAPPEPTYYQALVEAGRPRAARRAGAADPDAVFARLLAAFDAAPPFTGTGAPRLELRRWDAEGSHPVDIVSGPAPARARAMARRLEESWRRFVSDELTPAEERLEWAPAPRRSGGTG